MLADVRPRRVAVFRALQLGDLLCTVPALRALRLALPDARITLVGLPWAAEFVARFNAYLDGFLEFPGYPGLPEQPARTRLLPDFFSAARTAHFDLAIQMHGDGSISNGIVAQLGARHTAGLCPAHDPGPWPGPFLACPEDAHEIWRFLRLMQHLGAPLQGDELEFPIAPADKQALRAVDGAGALAPGSYVCLHPGARLLDRRWPPRSFAAIGDAMAQHGFSVILTGTDGERELARSVAEAMQAPALNLAGSTSLGALGALLADCRLLICNDTGVSHVAAALGTPSVVVFSASDPSRWAPLDRRLHRIVLPTAGEAASPAAVLAEAEALLDATPAAPVGGAWR